MKQSEEILSLFKGIVSDSIEEWEVKEIVTKEEVFAKEARTRAFRWKHFFFVFVLIVCKFRKSLANLQK